MLIENQLSSLDQSLKLKALGVDQTSLFYWQKAKSTVHKESIMYCWTSNAVCSAFTLAELGEMVDDEEFWLVECRAEQSRASATADHLIWLLENSNIDLDGVNKRLTTPNYPPPMFEPTNWEKR